MAEISPTETQVADFSPVVTIFQLISRFFTPFLSQKGLVSRRLCKKQGLFKSKAGIAMHELTQRRKGAETQAGKEIVSRQAGGACTHSIAEFEMRSSEWSETRHPVFYDFKGRLAEAADPAPAAR
jgi:hypothetical protein